MKDLFCKTHCLESIIRGCGKVQLDDKISLQFVVFFFLQVGRNHSSDPQLFSSLLMKLPELRNLGAKHCAHLDWFRIHWQMLRLPPLFAEIFDIPKCEEDLQ